MAGLEIDLVYVCSKNAHDYPHNSVFLHPRHAPHKWEYFPRYPVILLWFPRIANVRGVSLKDAFCKARYIFGYPEDAQQAPPFVSQGVGRRCARPVFPVFQIEIEWEIYRVGVAPPWSRGLLGTLRSQPWQRQDSKVNYHMRISVVAPVEFHLR